MPFSSARVSVSKMSASPGSIRHREHDGARSECTSGLPVKLELIKAGLAPMDHMPNHRNTKLSLLRKSMATTSPCLTPNRDLSQVPYRSTMSYVCAYV
jgi:hypothetical protein